MEQIGIGEVSGKHFFTEFKHKYSLFIPNLIKIISIQMENFCAGYGKREGEELGFLWGEYHISVRYHTYCNNGEILRKRTLYRPFFFILNTSPGNQEHTDVETDYFCETTKCNYHVTPIFLSLFPLLSKLKFRPFKVAITVHGKIYSIEPLKTVSLGGETSQEELETEFITKDSLDFDTGNKVPSNAGNFLPDAKYYQTYKGYYDMLLNQAKNHRNLSGSAKR